MGFLYTLDRQDHESAYHPKWKDEMYNGDSKSRYKNFTKNTRPVTAMDDRAYGKHCRRSLDGQTMYNSYHKPQNTMLTCPKNTRKNIAELCRITRLQPASGLMRNNSKVRVELT